MIIRYNKTKYIMKGAFVMKGHLEIFEHRLKNSVAKLPRIEQLDLDREFLNYEQALGESIKFYDVQSGQTLADYYTSTFVQFIKEKLNEK